MKNIFLALLAVFPAAVGATSFPGRVDPTLVGDWQCGETRAYITERGSIELLDSFYRSGRFDAADGTLVILWDTGLVENWRYEVQGKTLALQPPEGKFHGCTPRD